MENSEPQSQGSADKPKEAFTGSSFKVLGSGITLGCISREARDLLERVMQAWEPHLASLKESQGADYEPGHYGFAYWLIRWSGLVAPSVGRATEEQGAAPVIPKSALPASTQGAPVVTEQQWKERIEAASKLGECVGALQSLRLQVDESARAKIDKLLEDIDGNSVFRRDRSDVASVSLESPIAAPLLSEEERGPRWLCKRCNLRWTIAGMHPDCDGEEFEDMWKLPSNAALPLPVKKKILEE